jgi:hypothetical protein
MVPLSSGSSAVIGLNATGPYYGVALTPQAGSARGYITVGSTGIWRVSYSICFQTQASDPSQQVVFSIAIDNTLYALSNGANPSRAQSTAYDATPPTTNEWENVCNYVDLLINSGQKVQLYVGGSRSSRRLYIGAVTLSVQRIQ